MARKGNIVKKCICAGLGLVLAMAATTFANEVATARVGQSLENMAENAKAVLAKERIHDVFDWYRKLTEFGLTYQPSLMAPNDLVGKLNKEQLRCYAGIKLFDALYAATFMKRQDVADCIRVLESIQDTLDIRSHADINNDFLQTLTKAASRPDEVDITTLIDQLASDYVRELPALLSSVESADYLIESLYGLFIQKSYIFGSMTSDNPNWERLREGCIEHPGTEQAKLLLDLFDAFDRLGEDIRVSGETYKQLEVIREELRLSAAMEGGTMTREEARPCWRAMKHKVHAIRNAILTPDANK